MTKRTVVPATVRLIYNTEEEAKFATRVLTQAFEQLRTTHSRVMRIEPGYRQFKGKAPNWVVYTRVGFDQRRGPVPFDVQILNSEYEYDIDEAIK